jgi:hypothetical protein
MSHAVPSLHASRGRSRTANAAILGSTFALVVGLWLVALVPSVAAATSVRQDLARPAASAVHLAASSVRGAGADRAGTLTAPAQRDHGVARPAQAAAKGGISMRLVAFAAVAILAVVFVLGGLVYWQRSRR